MRLSIRFQGIDSLGMGVGCDDNKDAITIGYPEGIAEEAQAQLSSLSRLRPFDAKPNPAKQFLLQKISVGLQLRHLTSTNIQLSLAQDLLRYLGMRNMPQGHW
jgi:hypothetical protein